MIEKSDLNIFFSLAETKIKLAEEVKRYYGKEIAPNFNSFNFWSIDENKVSEIIAFFLNPHESHEQGDIFLRHFVKEMNLDFFQFCETDKINVKCEFTTFNKRRIDILIRKNGYEEIIAIENKIYVDTADQTNQIIEYLHFLESKAKKKFKLIYLAPRNKVISSESISDIEKSTYMNNGQLVLLTYEDHLITCLEGFERMSQNIRVRSFLSDFVKKLKSMYMGEKSINLQDVVIDLINENHKNLEISFLIQNSLDEVKKQLKSELLNQIKEIGSELDLEVNQLKLRPKKWTKHDITFNYESGGLLFGIMRIEKDINRKSIPEIQELLEGELNVKFNVSEYWPLWQFFYSNIEKNDEFWIDIKSGKFKERAKKFITLIVTHFDSDMY